MNITYKLQGRKAIKKLSVRFYHNALDISAITNVMLTDAEWDAQNQVVIDNAAVTIALQDLKSAILRQYNKDFCNGVLIDKSWLQKVIKTSFGRPSQEESLVNPDHTIYVSDFSQWWLDTHAEMWKVSSRKTMGVPLQNQYLKFVKILKNYEGVIGEKLQLRNIRITDLNSFAEYLDTELYQTATIERHIGRLRFFLNRAIEHNIEVNNSFKQRIYFDKDDDFEGVYLNEAEIAKIVKTDFSHNEELHIAKQNAIIGLHTGLRISDFMKLDMNDITDDFFKVQTKKTKTKVVIPIHPEVRKVIAASFGHLPPKMSSSDFNLHIKTICKECGIDHLVYGKLFDKDLKRKKVGYFEKYKLISSHVCRRSFATNNYGRVSNEVLNSICGWSKKSKQLEHYNKTSKVDHAVQLQHQWENKN